jgi:diguanylate cyclase (GGDEF)-like protein/PAS domain S-box-containing protein
MTSELFEDLYRRAPFGYLTTDPHDVILRVNDTMIELCGYPEEHLIGRTFAELLAPGGRLFYETRHLPVLRLQGHAREVLLGLARADGSTVPILLNADVVDGDEPGVRVAVLAATERESYERNLLAAQRAAELLALRVAVLQDAAAQFSSTSSEAQLTEALSTIVGDALVATASCVALIINGELKVVAGTNLLDGLVDRSGPRPGPDAMQAERPVVVSANAEGAADYPAVAAALERARLQTLIAIPIMREGVPIGTIGAFFARERKLDANEVDLVTTIARQAAQVLVRLRIQEQLAHQALHDHLTGLANRQLLRERLAKLIASTSRTSQPLSVMFLDLDGFKAINDRLGHQVGDAILRDVAARLTGAVRELDELGRYGGDEFVVICADTTADDALSIAARVREAVRQPFDSAPGFALTASIGVATYDPRMGRPVSTDEILRLADTAMYESKRDGRDRTTPVTC